jgi:hypothetical protein
MTNLLVIPKKNPAFPPAVSPNHGKHPDGNTRITKHKWQKISEPFIKKKGVFAKLVSGFLRRRVWWRRTRTKPGTVQVVADLGANVTLW